MKIEQMRKKNIFVTGIAGFIGSHIANELITIDYKVVVKVFFVLH